MPSIAVSYVNEHGFRIVTTHYDAAGVQLRLAELARAGIEAAVSEPASPCPAQSQREAARHA